MVGTSLMASRGAASPAQPPRALPAVLCPRCGAPFRLSEDEGICTGCGRAYPVSQRVLVLSPKDGLYEDQMTVPLRVPAFERTRGPLKVLAYMDFRVSEKQARPRFLFQAVRQLSGPPPKRVLDVGCGGGKEILTSLGPVAGVDISLTALANARSMYGLCVRHDVRQGLPFPDQSFDVVNCNDVLGHFSADDRDRLLREIRRVLRRGGHFIVFVETWSRRYAANLKKFPDWYPAFMEEMIARSGHIGLEPPAEVRRRLGRHGFAILREKLFGGRWGYTRGHISWASEKYPAVSTADSVIRAVGGLAVRNLLTESLLDDVLGLLDLVTSRSVTEDDAIALLVLAQAQSTAGAGAMDEGASGPSS